MLFLGTCLGFAETTLGMLASFAGTNGTLAAIFALVSLGMALLSLVAMYFRDPAFLTFSSQQALDLRILQEIVDRVPPDLVVAYIDSINSRTVGGQPLNSVRPTLWTDAEIGEIESSLDIAEDSE